MNEYVGNLPYLQLPLSLPYSWPFGTTLIVALMNVGKGMFLLTSREMWLVLSKNNHGGTMADFDSKFSAGCHNMVVTNWVSHGTS